MFIDEAKIRVKAGDGKDSFNFKVNNIQNDFDNDPVWSYNSVGTYICTLTGEFTANKTQIILPENWAGVNDATGRATFSQAWNSINDFYLSTGSTDSGGASAPANGFLSPAYSFIEVRVYP